MNINPLNTIQPYIIVNSTELDTNIQVQTTDERQDILPLLEEVIKWDPQENESQSTYPIWDLKTMPLSVHIERISHDEDTYKIIQQALLAWENATSQDAKFVMTLNPHDCDIKILWSNKTLKGRQFELGHNKNEVSKNKIIHAEITLIQSPRFFTDGRLSCHDILMRTVLHELGHALGLIHSPYKHDLMFHRATNQYITEGDVKQFKRLYEKGKREIFL